MVNAVILEDSIISNYIKPVKHQLGSFSLLLKDCFSNFHWLFRLITCIIHVHQVKLHLYRRLFLIFNVPCPERGIEWLPKVLSYKRIFIQPRLKLFEVHSFIWIHHLFDYFLPELHILLPQILVLVISSNTYHWDVIWRIRTTVTKAGLRLIGVITHGFVFCRLGCLRTIVKTLCGFHVGILQVRVKHLNWAHLIILWFIKRTPVVIRGPHVLLTMIFISSFLAFVIIMWKRAETWSVQNIS